MMPLYLIDQSNILWFLNLSAYLKKPDGERENDSKKSILSPDKI